MDEFRARCMELLDLLQVRLMMAADNGMQIVRQYSDEGRNLALRAINDTSFTGAQTTIRHIWGNLLEVLQRLKEAAQEVADPTVIYEQLRILFRDELARNNAYFVLVGLGFGTTGGFLLGFWLARPHMASPIMKAIACISMEKKDNVALCNSSVPQFESATDILVRVKAVALNRIDKQISTGYGKTLRKMIQRYDSHTKEFPLVIGRSCSGIVEAVGKLSKSGLEIGDEVWLVSPWYEAGVASELVVAPETRITRKPFLIGFEGAASLPYSGCIALNILELAGLNEHTSIRKRILIQDACSPIGCVLSQLTNKWGAYVTATVHSRSAPIIHELGASDIITFSNENFQTNFIDINVEKSNFINELATREKYDFIFLTTKLHYDHKFVQKFLTKEGILYDVVEPDLLSDNFGSFMKLFLSIYVRLRKLGAVLCRSNPDWGGPHLCHMVLERLAGYVNDETLKTVVDRVYNPQEYEQALEHICSDKSIGSTIITFR